MHLAHFLCPGSVIANMRAVTKDEAFRELAEAAAKCGLDKGAVLSVLHDREKLGSTAVGEGYAIPHGKLPGLSSIMLFFARSGSGVDCNAPDGKKTHFFFMVLAPENAAGQHLGLLGAIARLTRDATFTTRLMQAQNASEITSFLSAA